MSDVKKKIKLCWGCKKPLEQLDKEVFGNPVWVCANQHCPRFGMLTVMHLVASEAKAKEIRKEASKEEKERAKAFNQALKKNKAKKKAKKAKKEAKKNG